ncbi:diguanylate cyclase domain-containing protein [Duganella lactea]|nr:diguanylate cyclase [Duganella lactea]
MPCSNVLRRRALSAALCLLLMLLGMPARANHGVRWGELAHTAFRHHGHPDLSSGVSLAQDRQGFVWIGTQSGLVRWDGNRHIKYLADGARNDALPDSYLMSLHVDSRGRLWAGMNSGGLVRYNAEHDNFIRYRAIPSGQRDPRVSAIIDDGRDGLWIGTGAGLDHLDADGRFTRLGAQYGADALPDGGVEALLRQDDGALWAGTRHGLFLLRPGRPPQQLTLGGQRGLPVARLLRDSAGRLWIGTGNSGAFLYQAGAALATGAAPVRESGTRPTLQQERISAIVEAAPDEIWFGTHGVGGGIVVLDVRHGATRRIRHRADTPDSLADNDVMTMLRERSGIIYVASMAGLSQYDPRPRAVATIRHLDASHNGVLSVPSLLQAADGKLWLGKVSGGIDIVDPLHGLRGRLDVGAGLPQSRVLALASGPDGEVYIGTQQGLFRADADGRRAQRVHVARRRDEEEVWALALVGRTLWVGGLDGLWALRLPSAGAPQLLRHEGARLGDTRVTALLPLDDDVWVGTRNGLARVGPETVEQIPTDLAAPDRLPPGFVSSMLRDRDGRLWLSNFGTGIVILDDASANGPRRFHRLGMRQGLPDRAANKLLQDRDGMIWASTDNGLARIDPRTLAVRALGIGEGVHVPSYWTNAGALTDAGEPVFGGLSGLSVVRPQALSAWHYTPPLVVTRILLNDQELPAAVYNAGLGRKAPPLTVTTAARERGFSLDFAALDYSAPERNRYAYRLLGFDSGWVSTEAAARRASYNNLPPGDYLLQLRGSNRNGDWAPTLEVPVRVLPAWHQRTLARVAAVLTGLLLGAGLMQARTTYLRRRQHELEAMVAARTAELRATQAQLEALAYSDPLTGLANRRLFNDALRHLVAQAERGGAACTLLLIDLDRFKLVNDTHGHDAGDALLAATAARLRAAVREADQPFRLGGDEFAVLLSQTADHATLAPVCERILAQLAAPLPHDAAVIEISVSVGAAIHQAGHDHEQLYKRADLALYEAKAAGRCTWRLRA